MDASRFDGLTRTLQASASRRPVLGLLLGGALAVLAHGEPANAKKKKKFTVCLNGETKTVPKSKKAKILSQGAVSGPCPKDGSCNVNAHCKVCNLEVCTGGKCACKGSLVRDASGVCSVPINEACIGVGQIAFAQEQCCSTVGIVIGAGQVQCVPGTQLCKTAIDCTDTRGCIGHMCPPLYLANSAPSCSSMFG